MVKRDCGFSLPVAMPPLLSFPQSGNVLHKSLDSSFRWNDDVGDRYGPLVFKVIPAPVIAAPFGPLPSFSFLPSFQPAYLL